MAEAIHSSHENDEIVIQLSPWGEFFVWVAKHVERLRREHRIVGHFSVSAAIKTAAGCPIVSLPLCLSLEETALVIFRRFAVALDSVRPLRCLDPPSSRIISLYDHSLALHRSQSMEIYKQQKKQRTINYHDEILKGQNKRKAREDARASCGRIKDITEDDGVKLPNKCRKKRRKIIASVESVPDYLEKDISDGSASQQGEIKETLGKSMPTTSFDDAKAARYIPLHRPGPTPLEWRRSGEHTTLLVPETARDSIEKVALWLLEVSSKLRLEGNQSDIVRCRVFDDLWSRNFYVTCSALKMGGDFLVYQGDPLFHHASHIVITNPLQTPISLSRLSASLRIANSVRKALVIATISTADDHGSDCGDIAYTSLYWTGSCFAQ